MLQLRSKQSVTCYFVYVIFIPSTYILFVVPWCFGIAAVYRGGLLACRQNSMLMPKRLFWDNY